MQANRDGPFEPYSQVTVWWLRLKLDGELQQVDTGHGGVPFAPTYRNDN